MAVGLPAKTTYADGDVFSASDINDTNGTLNLVGQTTNFYAGKNKIINGDFSINQRGFTSNTTSLTYNFDRWLQANGGTSGTFTVTPQTFTPGAAPVAGYEGKNFFQGVTAAGANSDTFAFMIQRIEDVRTLAGQTATFSFYAKANSGTPEIALEIGQNFGSGGSPSASVLTTVSAVTISTSWARYSITTTVPALTGKTIGTTPNTSYLAINLWLSAGSDFNARASSIGLQNNTFDIWGVQLEAGSTATAFQTATGTIQGELAACQRYYFRQNLTGSSAAFYGFGMAGNTTSGNILVSLPVTMRVKPSAIDFPTVGTYFEVFDAASATTLTGLSLDGNASTNETGLLYFTVASGLTGTRSYFLRAKSGASSYLGWSAEL